jgi:hypothetical protein
VLAAWHVLCAYLQQAASNMSFTINPPHLCRGLQVSGQSMVDVQFYALKRVLRGMDLAPEKIEVLPAAPGCPTYTLRIISKIAFKLWSWRRCDRAGGLCDLQPASTPPLGVPEWGSRQCVSSSLPCTVH